MDQVKVLFQKSTDKLLSKRKLILQRIHKGRMKKFPLENVVAILSSIKLKLLRKRCHGARCNSVHRLKETSLWQMFCLHLKNNLKIWKKGRKFCSFIFKFQQICFMLIVPL